MVSIPSDTPSVLSKLSSELTFFIKIWNINKNFSTLCWFTLNSLLTFLILSQINSFSSLIFFLNSLSLLERSRNLLAVFASYYIVKLARIKEYFLTFSLNWLQIGPDLSFLIIHRAFLLKLFFETFFYWNFYF